MHWFSVGIALLVAVAIMVLGILYLFAPMSVSRSFGLPLPGNGPNVPPWLRLKGSRDIVSGLVVFALVAWGEPRILGIVLLILAATPLCDMSVVLSANGSRKTAFGVHGVTAAVIICGAVPLIIGLA